MASPNFLLEASYLHGDSIHAVRQVRICEITAAIRRVGSIHAGVGLAERDLGIRNHCARCIGNTANDGGCDCLRKGRAGAERRSLKKQVSRKGSRRAKKTTRFLSELRAFA